ncbi:MAG: DUF5718 family protein [Plesiomonas sp.]|uniref:DUF5718 family protein n=1 Tax=Plesiomonas sp. TaxID=2486279 RepID=UPI003F34CCC5
MNFQHMIGLGVAGNFAGHLEQAGEAKDFVAVAVSDAVAPKAIFPFYVPNTCAAESAPHFLHTYPLSSDHIVPPADADNLQIEPEVAIVCDIHYQNGQVVGLTPRQFAAYNDCSIRRPNAKKISEKKNWGMCSKGVSATLLDIDKFAEGGVMDDYRIACYLVRDGQVHAYGIDSPVVEYSYFHHRLLDWLINQMNFQQDQGPAENIAALLKQAGYPAQALISIGATRYTEFGETHFLRLGDRSVVVVYNSQFYSAHDIEEKVRINQLSDAYLSALVQQVDY